MCTDRWPETRECARAHLKMNRWLTQGWYVGDVRPWPQAHWTLNRPAAQGEYTPMGSANRACLI